MSLVSVVSVMIQHYSQWDHGIEHKSKSILQRMIVFLSSQAKVFAS